jgi:hypothetical protein
MTHTPDIRRFQAGDAPAAAAIIRGLPDYFTGDVPAKVEHDAASHQALFLSRRTRPSAWHIEQSLDKSS